MAPFDDLPADQKAVLQLVLRQGRSYDEIADLLKISTAAVRERALTALDGLAAEADEIEHDQQDLVGDFLLGQQPAAERAAARDELRRSGAARAWAQAVADELAAAGLAAPDALPEIPSEQPAAPRVAEPPDAAPQAEASEPALPGPAAPQDERTSRLGGVLLLGAVLIAAAAALLLAFGVIGGGGSDKTKTNAATTSQTQTTSGTQVEAQINLHPPAGATTKALGVANIVVEDGQRAIGVVGQGLPAGNHYVLWLRKGAKVEFLGFFPPVAGSGANQGRLRGLRLAPADLANYDQMLISSETSDQPKTPTTVVLQGSLGG